MNAPLVIPGEPPSAAGATPVMAQYFEAKARQPDALIFFRMGDFYELFFEDAAKAARPSASPLPTAGRMAASLSRWRACRSMRPRPISPS